jgi:hypothetical protein
VGLLTADGPGNILAGTTQVVYFDGDDEVPDNLAPGTDAAQAWGHVFGDMKLASVEKVIVNTGDEDDVVAASDYNIESPGAG